MKAMVFLLLLRYCFTYDYCSDKASKKLCKGEKHIACCSDKDQSKCITNPFEVPYDKGKAVYPMTQEFISMILNKHNELRDSVACGDRNYTTMSGQTLPVPSTMNEVIWSDELAGNVRILMKNCIYGHSKCHSTSNFPCSGQNLGRGSAMIDNRDFALKIIQLWFDEYLFVPDIKDLQSFSGKSFMKSESIGHFTALIQEDQTHIGCTMVKCRSSSETTILFGCNYAQTNMVGGTTYSYSKDGKPGEKCEKKSKKYKCLCAPVEN
ncbi:Ag5r.2 family protein [Megaselia abdita]